MKQRLSPDSEKQRRHVNIPHRSGYLAGSKTSSFVDNRLSAITQRQLMADIAASPRMHVQRKEARSLHDSARVTLQRKLLNFSSNSTVQLQSVPEEETMQGQFETSQRMEEDEPLQGKFDSGRLIQREASSVAPPNNTGMPDNLKTGIESLSGLSMDNVKVHYNSDKPARLNALAYAQGTDIHLSPGQEQHLPHEAWHVVQQAQGRVKPTMQMKEGVPVNDDQSLEQEADVMGEKSLEFAQSKTHINTTGDAFNIPVKQLKVDAIQLQESGSQVIQTRFDAGVGAGWHIHFGDHVKYNGNNATRVNFAGRSKRQIGYAWEQVIQNNGLAGTKANQDFIDCKTWIRNNIA